MPDLLGWLALDQKTYHHSTIDNKLQYHCSPERIPRPRSFGTLDDAQERYADGNLGEAQGHDAESLGYHTIHGSFHPLGWCQIEAMPPEASVVDANEFCDGSDQTK